MMDCASPTATGRQSRWYCQATMPFCGTGGGGSPALCGPASGGGGGWTSATYTHGCGVPGEPGISAGSQCTAAAVACATCASGRNFLQSKASGCTPSITGGGPDGADLA